MTAKETIMDIRGLKAGYKENDVIEKIDLQIEEGKSYAIIGPNGSGKTTLIRSISRNLRPKSGDVLLYGEDIYKIPPKRVARSMAVLSQNNDTVSDATVKTLVQYGRFAHRTWWKGIQDEDNEIVRWALNKTGIDYLSHRKINTLSGGERQRAWIAMAIAQKPGILLLDEPTTYLDINHQLEIMELISKLNREEGITILMVLHDINHAIRYCDEIIVLKDKNIVHRGDSWSVIKNNILQNVFNVDVQVSTDEESKKPILYPKKVLRRDES